MNWPRERLINFREILDGFQVKSCSWGAGRRRALLHNPVTPGVSATHSCWWTPGFKWKIWIFSLFKTFFSFWLDKTSFMTKEKNNKIERLKPLGSVVWEGCSSSLKIQDRRTAEVDSWRLFSYFYQLWRTATLSIHDTILMNVIHLRDLHSDLSFLFPLMEKSFPSFFLPFILSFFSAH